MVDSNTSVDLSDETDHDLLEILISFREDDKSLSDSAFKLFVKRYEKIIWNCCVKITSVYSNHHELRNELYSDTLINIYNCSRFSVDGEKNQDIIKKRICGWLIKIIKHTFLKLNNPDNRPFSEKEYDAFKGMYQSSKRPAIPTYNERIVRQAFEQLNEREKDILWAYWQYYEIGEGSQAKNLPSDILNALVLKYNTTSANIRQIISRGNKKVEDFLKTNYQIKKR